MYIKMKQLNVYIISKMKYILDIGICIALIIFIIVRLVVNESSWMVGIQYISLGIAYIDLSMEFLLVTKKTKKFKKVLLVVIIGMTIYILIAILGSLQIVEFLTTPKAMDVITLSTLLLSLPQKLYLSGVEEEEEK